MKVLKTLLPLLIIAVFPPLSLYGVPEKPFVNHVCDKGDISRFDNNLNARDWEKLYDYINRKKNTCLDEKESNLTINGDIRLGWRNTNERSFFEDECITVRGNKAKDKNGVRIPRNDFDIRFNLYVDYAYDRAWGVAHLEFDNTAGVDFNDHECRDRYCDNPSPCQGGDPKGLHGSGFCCDLCLRKAYMGYNVCCSDSTRFDIEIGRRHLYHVFDSEVQFLSRFDGILLRYTTQTECYGDTYVYLGGFLIDERADHFGWIAELGYQNIYDLGFDVKYSFIDWEKGGINRCFEHNPPGQKFRTSQLTAYYHLNAEMLSKPAKFYVAALCNHAAKNFKTFDFDETVNGSQKYAWYVGFRMGEVICCGDWALDIQYQYVQAQAVPNCDVSGIGRGNWFDESLTKTGRGNTNYKGIRVEVLYAINDNLAFDARWQGSKEIDKSIGGKHHYSEFRLETVYAF